MGILPVILSGGSGSCIVETVMLVDAENLMEEKHIKWLVAQDKEERVRGRNVISALVTIRSKQAFSLCGLHTGLTESG